MRAKLSKAMAASVTAGAMVLSFVPSAAFAANTPDPWSIGDAAKTQLTVSLDGSEVNITEYEDVYVANPTTVAGENGYTTGDGTTVDQGISIYVPETAGPDSPILFIVNNAGWQSDSYAVRTQIRDGDTYVSNSDTDKIGAALARDFVIVSYGCRSRNDPADADGNYLGHSPATMTDTKAAIRYLRYNAGALGAGDTDRIFVNGTSGGGGLTAVIASSGNSADYYPSLAEIGAAGITKNRDGSYTATLTDDVFAAIAYCPINDLGSADAAYEWTYYDTRAALYENGKLSYSGATQEEIMAASAELKAAYGSYVNGLGLKLEDGVTPLTEDNLEAAIIALLEKELYEALDEVGQEQMLADLGYGAEPVEIPQFTEEELEALRQQVESFGMTLEQYFAYKGWVQPYDMNSEEWEDWYTVAGDGTVTFDYDTYLYYVARSTELKVAPAFSNKGMGIALQNEDSLFGTAEYPYSAFEFYSWNNDAVLGNGCGLDDTGLTWDAFITSEAGQELAMQLQMASPIPYLTSQTNGDSAPYWYVRHGMVDRDTSFALQTVLYYAMINDPTIADVNFEFAWGQPHAGDYDVQEAFAWVDAVLADAQALPFTDVAEGAWYYGSVKQAYAEKLMVGIAEDQFAPEMTMTREMFVKVLASLAGADVSAYRNADSGFADVPCDQWYSPYVAWAHDIGIANGIGDGKFGLGLPVTREQMAVFLCNYADLCGIELKPAADPAASFPDAEEISGWAAAAVERTRIAGIFHGDDSGVFHPGIGATRAEAATVFCNLLNTLG